MNVIQDTFKGRGSQKGFMFSKIKREGNVAIYSKSSGEEINDVIYYETVVINQHNGYKLGGVVFPPGENYPGDSQFGLRGWCYRDPLKAESKFQELINKSIKES